MCSKFARRIQSWKERYLSAVSEVKSHAGKGNKGEFTLWLTEQQQESESKRAAAARSSAPRSAAACSAHGPRTSTPPAPSMQVGTEPLTTRPLQTSEKWGCYLLFTWYFRQNSAGPAGSLWSGMPWSMLLLEKLLAADCICSTPGHLALLKSSSSMQHGVLPFHSIHRNRFKCILQFCCAFLFVCLF